MTTLKSANKAAVYISMNNFSDARTCAIEALDVADEHGCTAKILAKIYARLGTCEKSEKNHHAGKSL